jgi:hypothetical protein
MIITRHQLYAVVWAEPIGKLATRLQVSESTLRSLCKASQIPTPPRGYWRKLETGQACDSTPLPDRQRNPEYELSTGVDADRLLPDKLLAATKDQSVGAVFDSAQLDATDPRQLVKVLGDIGSANRLLSLLDGEVKATDTKTAVVLREWVEQARETLAVSSHVSQVLSACQQIAAGSSSPEWWLERSEKRAI